ncbi:helix-turn-helix domain-containing protein [Actinoplanes sp. NPDC051861]|uniref:magnesium transporter MgtE N-terminal domain-containing protein n=1 Tax=Actinoplanes sp. NPDC051861 TaxID=3155170 RepID=UPI00343160FE
MNTVAELAELLRRLRLTADRPSPTDDPPTLRELAVLTGLPHSTLGNAESGRVLPRVEVVYRFAQACGVPADQLAWWTQARNRAAGRRRRPAHPVPPRARPAPAARTPSTATDDPAQAEQLRNEITGVPLDRAAELLASRPPETMIGFLQRLHPTLVAKLLATMDPVLATGHLNGLQPRYAVACLNEMDPAPAARLLTLKTVGDAVTHLALMRPPAAAAALLLMPTAVLAQRLSHLDVDLVRTTVQELPLQTRITMLTGTPLPQALTAELLFSLSLTETMTLLSTTDASIAARVLVMLPPDPAAGFLTALPVQKAAKLLTRMPADHAAHLLLEMTGHQAAALLTALRPRAAGAVLSHTPVLCVARLLAWLPDTLRHRLLSEIRTEQAIMIRWHMETTSYQIWLRALSATSNSSSARTLTELATADTVSRLLALPHAQPPHPKSTTGQARPQG